METLNVTRTELKLEVEVDYDCSYVKLVASLPGLDGEALRTLSKEPNWCILRRRDLPRGIVRVEVALHRASRKVPALQLLKSHHLRPVFFPEFVSVLAHEETRTLKLPCLGSLWGKPGQVKLLMWKAGSFQVCSHHTSFPTPEFLFPAVAHDDVSSLMRIPM